MQPDPDHTAECETAEINGGKMDRFVTGTPCARPQNFAVAAPATVQAYHDYARSYALADRYFQPVVGQSSSNDMYFAVAKYTLVLLAWDEGGGYFDHVPPPPASAVDQTAHGTRLPLLALGRFARKGTVSHVTPWSTPRS